MGKKIYRIVTIEPEMTAQFTVGLLVMIGILNCLLRVGPIF